MSSVDSVFVNPERGSHNCPEDGHSSALVRPFRPPEGGKSRLVWRGPKGAASLGAVALVDVVVVSYNSRDRLRRCVSPLVGDRGFHVIVVDNAPPVESLSVLDGLGVTAISRPRNGGFSYGCNAGVRAGSGPYVLLLNPDASVEPEALRRLAAVLEGDATVGAVAPRILEEDGSLDLSLRRFPRLVSTFAQALFLHRVFPRAAWADEVVRNERAYERAGSADWVSG